MFSIGLISQEQQERRTVISVGLDPAVLIDNNRVGGGNLDFTGRIGVEDNIFKAQISIEYFNVINYFATSGQAGVILPLYYKGLYGTLMPELNLINRWGINDGRKTADNHSSQLGIGMNAGLQYEFNFGGFIEWNANLKSRPDLDYHYQSFDETSQTVFNTTFSIGYKF